MTDRPKNFGLGICTGENTISTFNQVDIHSIYTRLNLDIIIIYTQNPVKRGKIYKARFS